MRHSDTVYLLDASIYIFRAWFGYPDRFHDSQGRSVNAVYGYVRFLFQLLDELEPKHLLAAFDESLFSGFRHEIYPAYKANRALPDAALAHQLSLCREFTAALGISCVGDSVYEADDWLALGAATARNAGLPITLLTRDKDLAQLVAPGDCYWDWPHGAQQDYESLLEDWQVTPTQIPDLLALMGDSADNIPGVAGVGGKSARALLQAFADLETLYCNLEAVPELPVRGAGRLYRVLQDTQQQVLMFRELIRLHPPDAVLELDAMQWIPVSQMELLRFMEQNDLGTPFRNLVRKFYAE